MDEFGGLGVQEKHPQPWGVLKELNPFGFLPPCSPMAVVGICTARPQHPAPAPPGQPGLNLCVSISTGSRRVEDEAPNYCP